MATSIEDWMCQELSKLGIPASEENAKYILSIESAEDLQEHILELLDGSSPGVSKFIEQLLQRWQPPDKPPDNIKVYRKSIADDVYYGGKEKQVLDKQKKNKNNSSNTPLPSLSYDQLQNGVEQNGGASVHLSNKQIQESKKKSKFVPLFSQEGQEKTVIKLPGRHACECQAAKHRLINNCTKCGRVVCEQEGSGPCIFCGTLVCTREEMEILMRGSKKSEQLRYRLMKDSDRVEYMLNGESHDVIQKPNKSLKELEKAVKHKEKLLDYDRTSVRRTKVIDDESDYFTSDNKWLSKADKEKLKKREEELRALRHASRRDRKVTLDFAGRTVVVNDSVPTVNMYDVNDDVIQEVHFGAKSTKLRQEDRELNSLVNPDIEVEAPKFVTSGDKQGSKPSTKPGTQKKRDLMRIQDRELLEMSDDGMCMSMHQPWASLLVLGIKIHEGRTWYTPHRGRLWIAATSKSPALEEIADVEQSYRFLLKDANLQLPSHYPIGCLLGCVEVVDCLSQEEYREKFPDGESASPFVFICENPQELVVKFPIKGKHKIYKLENHIHQAAKKGLR